MPLVSRNLGLICAVAVAAAATPAAARPAATARLVTCDAGDCLLVRGHRSARQGVVRINQRAVTPSGGRSWQVQLPVATVRNWAAPFARTLSLEIADATGSIERREAVRLPVGLLGHNRELVSLVVHAP
jgi:hypothetical protein